MEAITSLPTIDGEDTISIGDEVWVNDLAPMAGRFGPVDCMPATVIGFLRDGQEWLVTVRQNGTLALPLMGEAWVHHAKVRQIS
jgi:hypothetical protein